VLLGRRKHRRMLRGQSGGHGHVNSQVLHSQLILRIPLGAPERNGQRSTVRWMTIDGIGCISGRSGIGTALVRATGRAQSESVFLSPWVVLDPDLGGPPRTEPGRQYRCLYRKSYGGKPFQETGRRCGKFGIAASAVVSRSWRRYARRGTDVDRSFALSHLNEPFSIQGRRPSNLGGTLPAHPAL